MNFGNIETKSLKYWRNIEAIRKKIESTIDVDELAVLLKQLSSQEKKLAVCLEQLVQLNEEAEETEDLLLLNDIAGDAPNDDGAEQAHSNEHSLTLHLDLELSTDAATSCITEHAVQPAAKTDNLQTLNSAEAAEAEATLTIAEKCTTKANEQTYKPNSATAKATCSFTASSIECEAVRLYQADSAIDLGDDSDNERKTAIAQERISVVTVESFLSTSEESADTTESCDERLWNEKEALIEFIDHQKAEASLENGASEQSGECCKATGMLNVPVAAGKPSYGTSDATNETGIYLMLDESPTDIVYDTFVAIDIPEKISEPENAKFITRAVSVLKSLFRKVVKRFKALFTSKKRKERDEVISQ